MYFLVLFNRDKVAIRTASLMCKIWVSSLRVQLVINDACLRRCRMTTLKWNSKHVTCKWYSADKWKCFKPIKCQCCPHIEASQLICTANQLTGFYMRAALALNGLTLCFEGRGRVAFFLIQYYWRLKLKIMVVASKRHWWLLKKLQSRFQR